MRKILILNDEKRVLDDYVKNLTARGIPREGILCFHVKPRGWLKTSLEFIEKHAQPGDIILLDLRLEADKDGIFDSEYEGGYDIHDEIEGRDYITFFATASSNKRGFPQDHWGMPDEILKHLTAHYRGEA